MPKILVYLLGDGGENKYGLLDNNLDSVVGHFCIEIESFYHSLFSIYEGTLNLIKPNYGFLNEDCFKPSGDEESSPIIKDSLLGISAIVAQIKFSELKIPNFTDLKAFTSFLQQYYHTLLGKYQALKPQSPKLNFLNLLSKEYGRNNKNYFLAIENAYSGICNILSEFANDFPVNAFEYFGYLSLIYQQLIKMGFEVHHAGKSLRTPIQIAYRDEGKGDGAFYDHYTIQKITEHPTTISFSSCLEISDLMTGVKNSPFSLNFGQDYFGKKLPQLSYGADENGLLVITGRARNTENKRPVVFKLRKEHEEKIIKQALCMGRPILSICAGSWRVWEALGGKTVNVVGHNCRSGMPRINVRGDIGYNMQIHRVDILKNSLLAQAMGYIKSEEQVRNQIVQFRPTVNSVHWDAADPNPAHIPLLMQVCASAIRDDQIAPVLHRTAQTSEVQIDSVEAFESKHGAPIFGIQWHPEAYNANDNEGRYHRNIINFMAKAGDAYAAKRRMLTELKIKFSDAKLLEKFSGLTIKVDKFIQEKSKVLPEDEIKITEMVKKMTI